MEIHEARRCTSAMLFPQRVVFALFALCAVAVHAEVSLPKVLGDHLGANPHTVPGWALLASPLA
jgi:hypothetical protein